MQLRRENPWHTLGRYPELWIIYDVLEDGVGAQWQGWFIVLDERLDQVERRCALMHEIVHFERQVGWPDATAATMEREEAIVRREAAVRLVPTGALGRFVAVRGEVEAITAEVVAQEFEVTRSVAIEAMWVLARREGMAA